MFDFFGAPNSSSSSMQILCLGTVRVLTWGEGVYSFIAGLSRVP